MKSVYVTLALASILIAAATSPAATIELTGGQSLTGEVLKDNAAHVVIDVGVAVLRVPRADIARMVDESQASTTRPTTATGPAAGPSWQLFAEGGFDPATIEQNVRRIGEAVVMVTSPGGQGSGFLITADGYLITNYHVISGETRLKVTVFGRTEAGFQQKHYKTVRIIALNPWTDLALLTIDSPDDTFTFAPMGKMNVLETGQRVFAIGNPLGLTRTVSQGIVSTTNRNYDGQLYIQTTTDINPGNSGGPLFNLTGEVIGVTSMGYLYLGGLNFAIPTDVVKRFIANRDAFAYDEDNPNSGFRYLQPGGREDRTTPTPGVLPTAEPVAINDAADADTQ